MMVLKYHVQKLMHVAIRSALKYIFACAFQLNLRCKTWFVFIDIMLVIVTVYK